MVEHEVESVSVEREKDSRKEEERQSVCQKSKLHVTRLCDGRFGA